MSINELLGNAGSRGGGNELVSCPGKEVIHPITSCYGKCCKFPHCGSVLAQVLTLPQIYKLFCNDVVSWPGEGVIKTNHIYEKWYKFLNCGSVLDQVLTLP